MTKTTLVRPADPNRTHLADLLADRRISGLAPARDCSMLWAVEWDDLFEIISTSKED